MEKIQAEKLDELVKIVDKENNFVKNCSRQEMREKSLTHQATSIFLINPNTKKYYVHLRHRNKKWAPHHWTTCFGGVVGASENFDDNASKEIEEEAGIKIELKEIGYNFYDDPGKQSVWSKVYLGFYDGELHLQEEECEEYKQLSTEEIFQSIQNNDKWAADTKVLFENFYNQLNNTKQ